MTDAVVRREHVPDHILNQLARHVLDAMAEIETYFSDPDNERAYQEWKAARDAGTAERRDDT